MPTYEEQVAAARAAGVAPRKRSGQVTIKGAVAMAYRQSETPPAPADVLRFVLSEKGIKSPGLDALSDAELLSVVRIGRTVDMTIRRMRGDA